MRRYLHILVLLVLTACGSAEEKHTPVDTYTQLEHLSTQYNGYMSLAPRGWAVSDECDALLFVALQQTAIAEPGPVEDAQGESGRWYRKPDLRVDSSLCSSDISRDMFMGLFVWIWHNKRLDLAEDIWDYGRHHNWAMGVERKDGIENRTFFLPTTVSLLAQLIHALGGRDHSERYFPLTYNTSRGFVSHLTLLAIHLRGEMRGGITDRELQALYQIRQHMSLSPLVHALIHKYTDGDQSEATSLLLSIWPSDRLPTTRDWKEPWRLQRSDGDTGLQPGEGDQQHSGGDFLFPAALVLGRL